MRGRGHHEARMSANRGLEPRLTATSALRGNAAWPSSRMPLPGSPYDDYTVDNNSYMGRFDKCSCVGQGRGAERGLCGL